MMQTFFTSCGSEVSGSHVPAVRNVGGAVRKRVSVTLPDSNRSSSWDLRRVRATRRTIIDYAAALPLAVSSVSTTGLTAGKDRHFPTICTRRLPCAATGKQGDLFTNQHKKENTMRARPRKSSDCRVMFDAEVAAFFGISKATLCRRLARPVKGEIDLNRARPQRVGSRRIWLRDNVERVIMGKEVTA